ncbi:MAG: Crp/Fnr family transcriptional regulator [Kiloniellaceae bacterium]
MSPDWITRFPELAKLTPAEQKLVAERAQAVSLPAQTTIFAPGMPAENFLLLLEGTVRVQQVSSGGREIVLYRVTGGESCIMTTACLLSQETYNAEGVTETQVDAVAVPKAAFDELMARSAEFRRFVFSDYSSRITDLLHVVEEVAFERIDKRLAQKLLDLADSEGRLSATHQELAVELGSAREVVSRHLKEFQRRSWLEMTRGLIRLTDRASLERLAAGS